MAAKAATKRYTAYQRANKLAASELTVLYQVASKAISKASSAVKGAAKQPTRANRRKAS